MHRASFFLLITLSLYFRISCRYQRISILNAIAFINCQDFINRLMPTPRRPLCFLTKFSSLFFFFIYRHVHSFGTRNYSHAVLSSCRSSSNWSNHSTWDRLKPFHAKVDLVKTEKNWWQNFLHKRSVRNK